MQYLPKNYQWLGAVSSLPLMVCHALELVGTAEAVGAADNPVKPAPMMAISQLSSPASGGASMPSGAALASHQLATG